MTQTTILNRTLARVTSIDALRGFIMVVMALDHANSFLSFGSSGEFWGGPLREFSSNAAFLTRFVTHICAPGFFFLMGISMIYFLASRKIQKWTIARIRKYFLVRGLIIVAVHFTLSLIFALPRIMQGNFGITFNVLYILGLSMIFSSLLLEQSPLRLCIISLISLIVPEFILGNIVEFGQAVSPILQVLIIPGSMGPHTVLYTFFPWVGFTLLGLAFGKMLCDDKMRTMKILPYLSLAAFVVFFILRFLGGFGNIRPQQGSGWLPFLYMTKYPPSLTFALFMMSANGILLYILEQAQKFVEKYLRFLLIFGRSALFFYVIHHFIYLIMMFSGLRRLPLSIMYIFWIIGLIIAYPLCKYYASFKQKQPAESIWRLF